MFIVTKTTQNGTEKPVAFVRKEDAVRYKRNLFLYDVYLSVFGENFARTIDDDMLEKFNCLFRRIGYDKNFSRFNEEDKEIVSTFEAFLAKEHSLTEAADFVYYEAASFLSVQLFDIPAPCDIQTSEGLATAIAYDDGCAKGVQIWLDDNIVCALDVYEKEFDGQEYGGEARVLVYKKEYAEDEEEAPIACITINR